MLVRLFALLTALFSTFGFVGSASANPPSKAQVAQMLSGYESVPTTAQWRAMGPEVLAVLAELYNDTEQPGYVRMRSVDAAGSFRVPAARTFLLAVARARGQGDLYVRAAVKALARGFGVNAIDDLGDFLDSRHVVVRETVARELGRLQDDRVRPLLERRRAVEDNEAVRGALDAALARR